MKRCVAAVLAAVLLLQGCALLQPAGPKRCQVTYLTLFDTVTQIIGYANSEAEFQETVGSIYEQLYQYHQLFDIYHDYEGVANLKTVNDQAGVAPVVVDRAVIELLLCCREYYFLTGGKVNVAMGSVLRLWHQARQAGLADPEQAQLPAPEDLAAAAAHSSFDSVIIDEAASTVYISDPETSLDVGAIAKGWAVQQVASRTPAGYLISVGGNVYATSPLHSDAWKVAVQDPLDANAYLQTISVTTGAVVTSGDYQRTYTVDGTAYHHIIDPDTQMPARYWCSVTVVCDDSGLADALSTALFLLPLEEGQALAQQCGAEALWVDLTGNTVMSPGFSALLAEN